MFITLTCPSYGKVGEDGTPADPGSYDYQRAAWDALHFAALFDRFIQNLRRVLGHDVQYFATIEPQKRPAPHVHIATVTKDMYGHLVKGDRRAVAASMSEALFGPGSSAMAPKTAPTGTKSPQRLIGACDLGGGEVFTFGVDLGIRGLAGALPTG